MREILFRGRVKDTNSFHYVGWCYGGLIYSPSEEQHYIVEHDGDELTFPVDSETIGQYIGVKDKNNRKIFKGDIVKVDYPQDNVHFIGIVKYYNAAFVIDCKSDECFENFPIFDADTQNYEVIGNIHDNPELLKEELC